jgi:hypothetical protein
MDNASAMAPATPLMITMCGATSAPTMPATSPKFAVKPSLNP